MLYYMKGINEHHLLQIIENATIDYDIKQESFWGLRFFFFFLLKKKQFSITNRCFSN